jgi:hypothetical protein
VQELTQLKRKHGEAEAAGDITTPWRDFYEILLSMHIDRHQLDFWEWQENGRVTSAVLTACQEPEALSRICVVLIDCLQLFSWTRSFADATSLFGAHATTVLLALATAARPLHIYRNPELLRLLPEPAIITGALDGVERARDILDSDYFRRKTSSEYVQELAQVCVDRMAVSADVAAWAPVRQAWQQLKRAHRTKAALWRSIPASLFA